MDTMCQRGKIKEESLCYNNPKRRQDIEDIRSLLRVSCGALNMDEVRGYFRLFGREVVLDEIIRDIGD